MITSDFNNYFRLSLNRALTGQEEITFFLEVRKIAGSQLTSDPINLSHKIDATTHCYDIGLSANINQVQAEIIFDALTQLFPNDSLQYSIS